MGTPIMLAAWAIRMGKSALLDRGEEAGGAGAGSSSSSVAELDTPPDYSQTERGVEREAFFRNSSTGGSRPRSISLATSRRPRSSDPELSSSESRAETTSARGSST